MVSFPQVSPLEPCAHLSPPPYAPHAPLISFFSILPPAQYWVRNNSIIIIIIIIIIDFGPYTCFQELSTDKVILSHYRDNLWSQNNRSILIQQTAASYPTRQLRQRNCKMQNVLYQQQTSKQRVAVVLATDSWYTCSTHTHTHTHTNFTKHGQLAATARLKI